MEILGYALAALVGISLGLIGGGGSILTVPILVYIIGISPTVATSYSLFIVGFTSLSGSLKNLKEGNVNLATTFLFGISSITTVFFTRKYIIPVIPETIFLVPTISISHAKATMLLFALLMFIAAIAMIKKTKSAENLDLAVFHNKYSFYKLSIYGIIIGFITGFLGAGGGFLLIPSLVLFLKMPMKKAVGTSLSIIALNSLIGFMGDIGTILMDWSFLIRITSVAVFGIYFGQILSTKIDGEKLKNGFGWFVLIMGISILFREIF